MSIDFHSGLNQGVAPVTYGQGGRPPRGDYGHAHRDYTCDQNWRAYTDAEHALYRQLYERQRAQLVGLACNEFIAALDRLEASQGIPRFSDISDQIEPISGWRLVGVPGLIPEEAFFALLAKRRFPVTTWIRRPEEVDYIVEPDVFHDLFGHVPLLCDPLFADYMQAYGIGGLKAAQLGACELLARLYWYTVEFGLINTSAGLRAYGAGILSSPGELQHAVCAGEPRRLPFCLERMMRTRYRIDAYQASYFVIDSFEQLFEATAPDFTPLYRLVQSLPEFDVDGTLMDRPSDPSFLRRAQTAHITSG